MKIIICVGIPASGKTTWAKLFCSTHEDWVRINRDDLRNMRGKYWVPKQEDLITLWEDSCITHTLDCGYNVILDSTNLNNEKNKIRVDKLKENFLDLDIEYKMFDISLEEAIKRDSKRENSVGANVIKNMYNKYIKDKEIEYNENINLPRCVIFDVDGTLAKMNGRSPYEWDRVDEDLPNKNIIELYNSISNKIKIIFTGRDGCCLQKTKDWLNKNNILYDKIFIRPQGNTEKDCIIKKRIYEENIMGKYYVDFVVDDRQQVVDMWRKELGITCLQVDYGNF